MMGSQWGHDWGHAWVMMRHVGVTLGSRWCHDGLVMQASNARMNQKSTSLPVPHAGVKRPADSLSGLPQRGRAPIFVLLICRVLPLLAVCLAYRLLHLSERSAEFAAPDSFRSRQISSGGSWACFVLDGLFAISVFALLVCLFCFGL